MKTKIKPKCRQNALITQEVVGEVMIYDLEINKAYLLNPTSSMIWNLCDGVNSVAEIARLISEELDEPVPEDLVWLALDQFKTDNLLDKKGIENTNLLGMSRREVVRKIGLGSMVALPLISSIVVPNSAQGQSCIPNEGLCAVPADCCSTCCSDVSDGGPTCVALAANGTCPACIGAPGCPPPF